MGVPEHVVQETKRAVDQLLDGIQGAMRGTRIAGRCQPQIQMRGACPTNDKFCFAVAVTPAPDDMFGVGLHVSTVLADGRQHEGFTKTFSVGDGQANADDCVWHEVPTEPPVVDHEPLQTMTTGAGDSLAVSHKPKAAEPGPTGSPSVPPLEPPNGADSVGSTGSIPEGLSSSAESATPEEPSPDPTEEGASEGASPSSPADTDSPDGSPDPSSGLGDSPPG